MWAWVKDIQAKTGKQEKLRVKQYYISTGKTSGFSIDIQVVGVSRNGDRVIVKPISGTGTFEISKHLIRNSYK